MTHFLTEYVIFKYLLSI
ncbi:stress response small protein YobI [Escherichia coli]